MKMLNKKSLVFIGIVLLGLSLSACDSSQKNVGTASNAKLTEPTTDEDGNIEVDVNIKGSQLHGSMNKSWKREEPTKKEQRNIEQVEDIFNTTNIEIANKLFECAYGDIESPISIWCLLTNKDGNSLNNYGVIIRSNGKDYDFADVCHGSNTQVDFDEKNGIIYLSGIVEDSVGKHVEVLYAFTVKKDGEIDNVTLLDPYQVQEYFISKMTYDVKQNKIDLKVNNKVVATTINEEDGEGILRAIAVGDQISYEYDDKHTVKVNVIPGIKFGVGSSLYYEDMPTITAEVQFNNGKFEFKKIKAIEE